MLLLNSKFVVVPWLVKDTRPLEVDIADTESWLLLDTGAGVVD